MRKRVILIMKYRSLWSERKKQYRPRAYYSYRAPVNIETARDSALRTFYANTSTRYKKKKGGKKRGEKKGSVNDSARRETAVVGERASDFTPRSPAGC